ncbi:hypothetical protein ACTJKS_24680, partial [Pseudomonas sp. 22189]|uniref:hypothetical protein n=1 Tax=Pseudomonas sp. 22189 TaxID=3453889 RepID=UPI003F83560C
LHAAVNTSFSPLSTEKIEPSKEPNITALSTPSRLRLTEATHCRKLRNSLNLKEFSVSTAPEVGRIIDLQNLPSTAFFTFLSYRSKSLENTKADL